MCSQRPAIDLRLLLPHLLLAVVLLGGCARTQPAAGPDAPDASVDYTTISDSLPADPEVDQLVAPYRVQLEATTSEVVGTAAVPLTRGGPESPLGNVAADALLAGARQAVEEGIEFAVTNNGGLRTDIAPGPIIVGDIFEVMPFENFIVVLTLTATEVDSLAQQIARIGGEPIAGWSFQIDEADRAVNVLVDGAPLAPERTYRVATINYLADGGGAMPALWTPQERINTTLLLRDAITNFVRRHTEAGEAVAPAVEGRITRVVGD